MEYKIHKIFKKDKNIIIGAIHFAPLLGYEGFPGYNVVLKNAFKDLNVLTDGGVDGVIIENNYDTPHKIQISKETLDIMMKLGKEIKAATKLPLGISVLWNDFKAALLIAKKIGAKFIRVPVFVDRVKTNYGIVEGNPEEVLRYRKKIKAQKIALFTDIQVKHAKSLEKKSIEQSAKEAIKAGSDALIITGKWTGDAPNLNELKTVRETVNDFPILIGSGADKKNIKNLLGYANGVIVGTSLKGGNIKKGEINVKGWKQRIDVRKVKEFIKSIKK